MIKLKWGTNLENINIDYVIGTYRFLFQQGKGDNF